MHEENFWSGWLREEERGEDEKTVRAEKKEEGIETKRGRSKEDVSVSVSVQALDIFSQGEDL